MVNDKNYQAWSQKFRQKDKIIIQLQIKQDTALFYKLVYFMI